MAKTIIDMSGRKGLYKRFFGDADQSATLPNRHYLVPQGQMAEGDFNPFIRYGYLSPTNSTLGSVTADIETTFTVTLGASVTWQTTGYAIAPAASTTPSVTGTPASGTTASGTSQTVSVTVPSGTARNLIVIASNATGDNAASATYNGTAMTRYNAIVNNFFVTIFFLAAPAVTTANVVVTWGTSSGDLAVSCFVVQNSHQTTPINTTATASATSASAAVTVAPTVANCFVVGHVMSQDATHTQASGQTQQLNFQTATPYRSSVGTINAVASALFASRQYDPINDDYYFGTRGRALFRGDTLDDTTLTQVLDLGATGSPVIHDLEIYQVNGVQKMFVIHELSDNLDIAISSLPYNSATDNTTWLSGTVSGGGTIAITTPYAFMRNADNGFAYVFADNIVYKIDGTAATGGSNGTWSTALTFPVYFRHWDALDYQGKLFIVTHQSKLDVNTAETQNSNFTTPCGVYVWDRQTNVTSMANYIPIEGVIAIKKIYVAPNGKLRLNTIGSNRLTQIREFNGAYFEIINELGILASPQYPDSLEVAGLLTVWNAPDGAVYGHGSPAAGEPEALAKVHRISSSSITAGALLYGASNSFSTSAGYRADRQGFTVGYTSSGSNLLKKIYPFDTLTINGVAQEAAQGDIYTGNIPLPGMSTVQTINLYFAVGSATGSTTQATVKIYFNGSTTPFASKTVTRDDINRGYKNIKVGKPYINSVQLEVEYAGGITLSDAWDFRPSYAEINHEPTGALAAA